MRRRQQPRRPRQGDRSPTRRGGGPGRSVSPAAGEPVPTSQISEAGACEPAGRAAGESHWNVEGRSLQVAKTDVRVGLGTRLPPCSPADAAFKLLTFKFGDPTRGRPARFKSESGRRRRPAHLRRRRAGPPRPSTAPGPSRGRLLHHSESLAWAGSPGGAGLGEAGEGNLNSRPRPQQIRLG